MGYRILAEGTMLLHFGFLVYVVAGGLLALRWPRSAWVHIPVALYALGIAVVHWRCPLTYVEDWARTEAYGQGLTGTGFIDHYLSGVVYPAEYLVPIQTGVGVFVALTYVVVLVTYLRRRDTRGAGTRSIVRSS